MTESRRVRIRLPRLPVPVSWTLLLGGEVVPPGKWVRVERRSVALEVHGEVPLPGGWCRFALRAAVPVPENARVDVLVAGGDRLRLG